MQYLITVMEISTVSECINVIEAYHCHENSTQRGNNELAHMQRKGGTDICSVGWVVGGQIWLEYSHLNDQLELGFELGPTE